MRSSLWRGPEPRPDPRGAVHAWRQAGLRYRVAREELAALGCKTTIEYLARMAELVLAETGRPRTPTPV